MHRPIVLQVVPDTTMGRGTNMLSDLNADPPPGGPQHLPNPAARSPAVDTRMSATQRSHVRERATLRASPSAPGLNACAELVPICCYC